MDKTGLAMEMAQIFTEKDVVSAVSRTVGAVKTNDVKIRENTAQFGDLSRIFKVQAKNAA